MKHPLRVLMVLLLSGCGNIQDRLLFIEESHIGLIAKGGVNVTPADIDFGYRRSVVALIPKANAQAEDEAAITSVAEGLAKVLAQSKSKAKEANLKDSTLLETWAKAEADASTLAEFGTFDTAEDITKAYAKAEALTLVLERKPSATEVQPLIHEIAAALTRAMAKIDPTSLRSNCPQEVSDRREPLSVISSFSADVRWFEATRVRTYFATGKAATQTACDDKAIKALVAAPNE